MAAKWTDALDELRRRAKEMLADLEAALNPEPELVPVPVRPERERGRDRRR